MTELEKHFSHMITEGAEKIILSKPTSAGEYRKIVTERKTKDYQIAKYTEKQVFHENITETELPGRLAALTDGLFRQVNGFSAKAEYILLISKKGECSFKTKKMPGTSSGHGAPSGESPVGTSVPAAGHLLSGASHNRRKNYLLPEGTVIPPLVDLGVFTKDGKVVHAMYDKYRQINRFLEILDDEISPRAEALQRSGRTLNIIDFGCGKSYLTFIVYYYLTEIRQIPVQMVGLDLKEDVIRKCNQAAESYGYAGLTFELGDINGYNTPFDVDMVITLHACDTATDYALFNAIQWKAEMIFSAPCCQHELNKQLAPENLRILSRYGIIRERFSALATDAIRGNLLEYCGYKTQLLEFIDFDHTPKNILIRAVRRPITPESVRRKAMEEVQTLMQEFGFNPTLYQLISGLNH